MVADFFTMAGWDAYFCCANTPRAAVVQSVTERAADVLAVSATMGSHLHAGQALIGVIRADARCARLRLIVGGHRLRHASREGRQPNAGLSGAGTGKMERRGGRCAVRPWCRCKRAALEAGLARWLATPPRLGVADPLATGRRTPLGAAFVS